MRTIRCRRLVLPQPSCWESIPEETASHKRGAQRTILLAICEGLAAYALIPTGLLCFLSFPAIHGKRLFVNLAEAESPLGRVLTASRACSASTQTYHIPPTASQNIRWGRPCHPIRRQTAKMPMINHDTRPPFNRTFI